MGRWVLLEIGDNNGNKTSLDEGFSKYFTLSQYFKISLELYAN